LKTANPGIVDFRAKIARIWHFLPEIRRFFGIFCRQMLIKMRIQPRHWVITATATATVGVVATATVNATATATVVASATASATATATATFLFVFIYFKQRNAKKTFF
jgi:hypothetical protein